MSSAIKQALDAKEYDWELHVAGIVCRLDSSFIFAVPRLRRIQEQSQYSVLGWSFSNQLKYVLSKHSAENFIHLHPSSSISPASAKKSWLGLRWPPKTNQITQLVDIPLGSSLSSPTRQPTSSQVNIPLPVKSPNSLSQNCVTRSKTSAELSALGRLTQRSSTRCNLGSVRSLFQERVANVSSSTVVHFLSLCVKHFLAPYYDDCVSCTVRSFYM